METIKNWLANSATLRFAFEASAGQNTPRLDDLFDALRLAPSESSADAIESEIWSLWTSAGNRDIDQLMEAGMAAMLAERYRLALDAFNKVVQRAPNFAEGWNKRATLHFLTGDYDSSVADVEHTLTLEPRHFGALSGLALIALELGEEERALDAFDAALDIHPWLAGRDTHIRELREKLRGRGI
ncbi:MAG: tetratricopeptide repeat protein [Alphaproteobacteria bacterium]